MNNPLNKILIISIVIVLLRIAFPVYSCSVPEIGYSSKVCPKGPSSYFSLTTPTYQTRDYGEASFYKPDYGKTSAQVVLIIIIAGAIYLLKKKKNV